MTEIYPLRWATMYRQVGELQGMASAIRMVFPNKEESYTISGEWLHLVAENTDRIAEEFETFLDDIRGINHGEG